MSKISNSAYITLSDDDDDTETMPKTEPEQDFPPGNMYLHQMGDNVASTSGTNLRSSFIGMGFSPVLIDKVIMEKGEDDIDLLLETLIELSTHQQSHSKPSKSLNAMPSVSNGHRELPKRSLVDDATKVLKMSKSTSSDSLDSLFDDGKDEEILSGAANVIPKQEPSFLEDNSKRLSLLAMNFSVKEVEFAVDRLGTEAPIYELVDFITAAQMAESEDVNFMDTNDKENNEVVTFRCLAFCRIVGHTILQLGWMLHHTIGHIGSRGSLRLQPPSLSGVKGMDNNPEKLYGTMDRTLRLLELGFTEQDVSEAIENFGPEVPITELADWICSGKPVKAKDTSGFFPLEIKAEIDCPSYGGQTGGMTLQGMYGGRLPKEEYDDSSSSIKDFALDDIRGKRVKEEYDDSFSAITKKPKRDKPGLFTSSPAAPTHPSSRSFNKVIAGPPFFFYGNVVNLSKDSWTKMSQFLYALEPEFANAQFFSAISRREGYLHNLPTDERFILEPKSPMTIEEAMPHTKKWWPSWDTRKQLSYINTETNGVTQICENLRKMMVDSRGSLTSEQQTKVLYHCKSLNLAWVGNYKLAPIETEYLEKILGYPAQHTKSPELGVPDQLEFLRNCFQTDTVGYHLSVLKCYFPDGMTVLSVYSGIGGAEVALHRLGIRLKGVVSVETSEAKRKIMRRWWESSGQTGELVQLEDAQKLSSNKLEYLMKKFGGFDLVVGQNPCTYTERTSKAIGRAAEVVGLDFTLYYEFVRVLQRVRSIMGRN